MAFLAARTTAGGTVGDIHAVTGEVLGRVYVDGVYRWDPPLAALTPTIDEAEDLNPRWTDTAADAVADAGLTVHDFLTAPVGVRNDHAVVRVDTPGATWFTAGGIAAGTQLRHTGTMWVEWTPAIIPVDPPPKVWTESTFFEANDRVTAVSPTTGNIHLYSAIGDHTSGPGVPAGTFDASEAAVNWNDLGETSAVMVGATAGAGGLQGLVPTPAAGSQNRFLSADGTWRSTEWIDVPNDAAGLENGQMHNLTGTLTLPAPAVAPGGWFAARSEDGTAHTITGVAEGGVTADGTVSYWLEKAGAWEKLPAASSAPLRTATFADAKALPGLIPGMVVWIENGGTRKRGAYREVLPIDPLNPTLDPALTSKAWSGWFGDITNPTTVDATTHTVDDTTFTADVAA